MHHRSTTLALLIVSACSGQAPAPDGGAPHRDAGTTPDAGAAPPDAGAPQPYVDAAEYCETIAPFFCQYYLRCDRMAGVDDAASCEAAFLSSCNDGFEQRYVDLAHIGLIRLSRAGLDACAAHLDNVACAQQIRDLDGPCAQMWEGTLDEGAACGIDVEGFICRPGTACVLDLTFCGTCEAGAALGEPCTTHGDCFGDTQCVAGACRARALPGEPCDDDVRCVVGATCTNNTCLGPAVVPLGGDCDRARHCAYKSTCQGGVCVEQPLIGEPCAPLIGCASGICEGATCAPRRDAGAACTTHDQCRSRQCIEDVCTPLPGACLAE